MGCERWKWYELYGKRLRAMKRGMWGKDRLALAL